MFLNIKNYIINSENIINVAYNGYGASHTGLKPIIIRYEIYILLKANQDGTIEINLKYGLDDKEKYDKDVKYLMEKLCYN